MSLIPVLAIDGPSGVGKGTVARIMAQKLGWHLLDSGAIYRAFALAVDSRNPGSNKTFSACCNDYVILIMQNVIINLKFPSQKITINIESLSVYSIPATILIIRFPTNNKAIINDSYTGIFLASISIGINQKFIFNGNTEFVNNLRVYSKYLMRMGL